MRGNRPPSATQFAVLGMVSAAPATGYALVKRMEVTYRYFWPRARSHAFGELRRLSQRGWLTASRTSNGKRASTTYAITPAGTSALKAWLKTPAQTFAFEIEGLLRLYLAPQGRPADLLGSMRAVEAEGRKMLEIARALSSAYLEGQPPPPVDELFHRAPLFDFFVSFAGLLVDWSRRTQTEVARWEHEPIARSRARGKRNLSRISGALRRR